MRDVLSADAELDLAALKTLRDGGATTQGAIEKLTGLSSFEALLALGRKLALPVLDGAAMESLEPDFTAISLSRAQQRCCVVLAGTSGASYTAVVPDPFDDDLMIWIESRYVGGVKIAMALASDIQVYLSRKEAGIKAIDAVVSANQASITNERPSEVLSFASVSDAASPAVQLLSSTIYDALRIGASDIHIESVSTGLHIRYRIDGVLDSAARVSGTQLAEQTISRLKVLSELDISEHRVPQDGSFRVQTLGRDIDLRVSIMPSIHGEDAVIRILDKQAIIARHGTLTLDALGFDHEALTFLRGLVEEPYGMLLVTGPTGSGKTTTLYGAIAEINSGRDKIITIEDPVEYQLNGVLQIPVNDRKGLTFARGLRSILRHDPDKIMVGEIRDRETAEIAVQSALTGHLVLTTVHANNVFDVFGRFTHMGLDPYAFSSALNGIWAQRLVRIICPRCARPYQPNAQELQRSHIDVATANAYQFRQGAGCGDCRGTGYRGRRAIAEILALTDEIRALITEKRPIGEIKKVALQNGTKSLHDAALRLVASGETTLEESRRVTLSA
jgi:general secretion pathway protein E